MSACSNGDLVFSQIHNSFVVNDACVKKKIKDHNHSFDAYHTYPSLQTFVNVSFHCKY